MDNVTRLPRTLTREQVLTVGVQVCLAVIDVAFIIMAIVGFAGAFPGASLGWATVGLASASFLLACTDWKHISRVPISALLIIIGALAGSFYLPASLTASSIMVIPLVAWPVTCRENC